MHALIRLHRSGVAEVLFCFYREQSIFQGTTELVRQLCDASADLVKVFPHENRPVRMRHASVTFDLFVLTRLRFARCRRRCGRLSGKLARR